MTAPQLVTGATGFVAAHLTLQLLEAGHTVHATVRSLRQEAKHPRPWLLPRHRIPDWMVRLIGPAFGLTQDYICKHLGIQFPVDNRRSIEELGIVYRPIRETLIEHCQGWLQRRGAPVAI